ncbi:hypothetical protein, partial [Thermoclostridium caenicola]|uniref:hypothetical protein n=1 Tax=Thermoclostridium caenicola TaxID=659425 RepID=UPI001A9C09DA
PFILSILGYIFDISKKTGILTHVKMPVFRQSGVKEGVLHLIFMDKSACTTSCRRAEKTKLSI